VILVLPDHTILVIADLALRSSPTSAVKGSPLGDVWQFWHFWQCSLIRVHPRKSAVRFAFPIFPLRSSATSAVKIVFCFRRCLAILAFLAMFLIRIYPC